MYILIFSWARAQGRLTVPGHAAKVPPEQVLDMARQDNATNQQPREHLTLRHRSLDQHLYRTGQDFDSATLPHISFLSGNFIF